MSALILPLLNPIVPLLLLTTLAYYLFPKRRIYVYLVSLLLLYFFSIPFPIHKLVQHVEFAISPLTLSVLNEQEHYNILVLGAGKNDDIRLSENQRLSNEVISRLVEAIKWCNRLPHFTLICSGPIGKGDKSQALLLKETAIALGVESQQIKLLEQVHNTKTEAEQYVQLFEKDTPLILCSSALHLNRAKAWFEYSGVRKIYPAPANFKAAQEPISLKSFLPQWSSYKLWQSYFKERIGLLLIRYY